MRKDDGGKQGAIRWPQISGGNANLQTRWRATAERCFRNKKTRCSGKTIPGEARGGIQKHQVPARRDGILASRCRGDSASHFKN